MRSNEAKINQMRLQEDLNALVQIVKIRQNQSFAAIQYIQDIFSGLQIIQQTLFLQDLILKHKKYAYKIKTMLKQSTQQQTRILDRYSALQICTQQAKVLIRRVGARLLQIFQLMIDQTQKYPHFINQIFNDYKIAKLKFLKIMNMLQKKQTKLTICQIFKVLLTFSTNQLQKHISKLQIIIQHLQEGQISQISIFFQSLIDKQAKNKEKQKEKQKQQLKANQNSYSKQKQTISNNLKKLREQFKVSEAIKKKKLKIANKILNLYNNAMQISKNQFIEDLTFLNKDQKIQRLMTDITLRNKNNSQFIKQFQEQTETFQERVSLFNKCLFYQNQLQKAKQGQKRFRNRLLDSPLQYKSLDYSGHLQTVNNQVAPYTNQQSNNDKNIINPSDLEKIQSRSFRITYANKKLSAPVMPKSQVQFIKPQKQQLNFVKICFQSQEQQQPLKKPKFPDISNRVFSMQNKRKLAKINKNQDQFKDHIKISLIKNIQIDINRLKKVKGADSGKMLTLQKKSKSTSRPAQLNYCSSVSKKINQFVQLVSAKNYA